MKKLSILLALCSFMFCSGCDDPARKAELQWVENQQARVNYFLKYPIYVKDGADQCYRGSVITTTHGYLNVIFTWVPCTPAVEALLINKIEQP